MLWSFNKTLSPVAKVTPSRVSLFSNALPITTLAVEATLTESFTSKPCLTASTYSFVANELVPNPALSLYPLGTVTVPVPCGV